MFLTVIVNTIFCPTNTTSLALTDLVIVKSTTSRAVMLGLLALLLDLLVSFCVLVTLTTLVMFPAEMTSVSRINCLQSFLAKSPIYHTPSVTL